MNSDLVGLQCGYRTPDEKSQYVYQTPDGKLQRKVFKIYWLTTNINFHNDEKNLPTPFQFVSKGTNDILIKNW